MPSYLYECQNDLCPQKEFEEFHGINIKLEECPYCQAKDPKRLISSGGSFILVGQGWAKDSYSK